MKKRQSELSDEVTEWAEQEGESKASLGMLAYERLREAIHEGRLKPGARLRIADLAKELRMSRTPLREALQRLESDGLVAHEPRSGMVIAQLDQQAVMEIYTLREHLEGSAAALAARHAHDQEIFALREIVNAEEQILDDPRKIVRQNRHFHEMLHNSAHNRFLVKAFQPLCMSMALLGRSTLLAPERAKESHLEHRQIVEALEARDAEAAEAVARRHFRNALRARLRMRIEDERNRD